MHAPLYDRAGKLRYFMGAQIDVSNVIDESPELETLQRVMIQAEGAPGSRECQKDLEDGKNAFQQFIETLDMDELKDVRAWEDRMLQESSGDGGGSVDKRPRRPGLPRNHHSEILKNGVPVEQNLGPAIGMYHNVGFLFIFEKAKTNHGSICLCGHFRPCAFSSHRHRSICQAWSKHPLWTS